MSKEIQQLRSLVDRKWKVLILDYDLNRLEMLENMLQTCSLNVTKCRYAKEAISMLEGDRNRFDIVITDLYLPDMDGFEILKRIGSEMDLPIIMALEDDDDEDLIKKGLIHGACDYLVNPIRIENVKHLWKYVLQKQRQKNLLLKGMEQSGSSSSDIIDNNVNNETNTSMEYCQNTNSNKTQQIDWATESSDGEDHGKCKKRIHSTNIGDAQVSDNNATKKRKQRVIWTPELHAKFVAALNQFGTSRPVPKRILEIMNVPGLTRENVASHLQKYRQYHNKRVEQTTQNPIESDANFMCSAKESFQKLSPLIHHNFQSQAITPSSSLQLQGFMSFNSHPQTRALAYGQHNIQMSHGDITSETNMNLRVVHHVEGDNMIFPRAISYDCSTIASKVHVVENPSSEMSLNSFVNGDITSTGVGAQPNGMIDAYENIASFDLGYNDAAALYIKQYSTMNM